MKHVQKIVVIAIGLFVSGFFISTVHNMICNGFFTILC